MIYMKGTLAAAAEVSSSVSSPKASLFLHIVIELLRGGCPDTRPECGLDRPEPEEIMVSLLVL